MTSLKNAIGTIIGEDERLCIWIKVPIIHETKNKTYTDDQPMLEWTGLAKDLPEEYQNCGNWKIVGIKNTNDAINILIEEEE